MNRHQFYCISGSCLLACAIIAYLPPLIIWPIFLYNQIDMGAWPQYALAWTLWWSIIVLIWGKLPSLKTKKRARIGAVLASFPIAFFIAFIIITFVSRMVIIMFDGFEKYF
jgi:hypothetical protein